MKNLSKTERKVSELLDNNRLNYKYGERLDNYVQEKTKRDSDFYIVNKNLHIEVKAHNLTLTEICKLHNTILMNKNYYLFFVNCPRFDEGEQMNEVLNYKKGTDLRNDMETKLFRYVRYVLKESNFIQKIILNQLGV